FLYGWMALLVMDPGLTAALATGAARYLGYGLQLSNIGIKACAIATIVLLALVNIRGVRLGAGAVSWLTLLKISFLLFIPLCAFGLGRGHWSNFSPFVARQPGSVPLIGALAAGLVGSFFSFAGWWDVSKITGEVRNPGRTMSRAFLIGISAVTLIYILT